MKQAGIALPFILLTFTAAFCVCCYRLCKWLMHALMLCTMWLVRQPVALSAVGLYFQLAVTLA